MEVSCIVDSIAGKMGLLGEQNITNHIGVMINATARFQPATRVHKFKMLKLRRMCYGYNPSLFNVRHTLRVEVSTTGLNNRANSESYTVYVHVGPICNGC